MPSGGGYFQRPFGCFLPLYFAEIGPRGLILPYQFIQLGFYRGNGVKAAEVPGRLLERMHSFYLQLFDQRRLGAVCCRKIKCAAAKPAGAGDGCGHGQGAGNGAQGPVQRQFAHQNGFSQLFVIGNLARGGEQPDGDGQVKARTLFFQVGRGQVDGNPFVGKFEAAVAQSGADPLPGFFNRGIGQPDDVKVGHSPVNIHFHFQGNPLYS